MSDVLDEQEKLLAEGRTRAAIGLAVAAHDVLGRIDDTAVVVPCADLRAALDTFNDEWAGEMDQG